MSGISGETVDQVLSFRDDRDWRQFHNPKDLAISISLEAAELLEPFQWSGADTSAEGKEQEIRDELADVMIYCLMLADTLGIDPDAIIQSKLSLDREKYPVEKAKGSARKYTEL